MPREDGGEPLGPLSRLLLRAKAGDRAALEAFASAICSYVLWAVRARMTPRLCRSFEIDDLFSIAWIAILENLDRLDVRGDAPLKAWLRRLVTTRLQDAEVALRAEKRDPSQERSLDLLLRGGDAATPARLRTEDAHHVRDLWNRVELARVAAALALLPSELAETVWLVDFDGCGLREAGRLLDVPEATVRDRYAKGKARLAALLCDEADPES